MEIQLSSLLLMSVDVRAHRWVFTLNNPTAESEAKAKEFLESTRVVLVIAEREVGEQGTPHIQGFFCTDKDYHRSTISVWMGSCEYLEKAIGSRKSNYLYCTKEGPDALWMQKGIHYDTKELDTTDQGFAVIHKDLKTKAPAEFEEEHPQFFFFHRQQCLAAMLDFQESQQKVWPGRLPDKNFWVWGKTGTGKTLWAYRVAEGHHMFRKKVSKWWDGYDAWRHDLVLVDEWPAASERTGLTDSLCSLLKNWSDRYSFTAEIKGGHVMVHPGRFILIVTSQYPIQDCFTNGEDILALKRRFHEMEFRYRPGQNHPSYVNDFDDMNMYVHGELIESMRAVPYSILDK